MGTFQNSLFPSCFLLILLQRHLHADICEYRRLTLPTGEVLKNISNVVSWTACCDECGLVTNCTAYSYNQKAQDCKLWEHIDFVDTENTDIYSGLLNPLEIDPPTTDAPEPVDCPDTGSEISFPHPTDCSKYYKCILGVKEEMSCVQEDVLMLYSITESRCRFPQYAECHPGATPPTTTIKPTGTPPTDSTAETTTTTTTTSLPIECPPNEIVNLPHPENCTIYIKCMYGAAVVESCPPGQYFDDKCVEGTCAGATTASTQSPGSTAVTSTGIQSTTTTITTSAPISTSTKTPVVPPFDCGPPGNLPFNLPHPDDCTKYVRCSNGVGEIRSCAPERYFDTRTGTCLKKDEAMCYEPPTTPTATTTITTTPTIETSATSTEPTTNGSSETTTSTTISVPSICPPNAIIDLPHPENCSQYVRCIYGEGSIHTCPDRKQFDYIRGECVESDAVCFGSSTTVSSLTTLAQSTTTEVAASTPPIPLECPPTEIIDIPCPDDCSKFTRCVYGTSTILSCPPQTLFDYLKSSCLDEGDAVCYPNPKLQSHFIL